MMLCRQLKGKLGDHDLKRMISYTTTTRLLVLEVSSVWP